MRIRGQLLTFIERDLSPPNTYRLCKTIDGYPGDGTFGLAANRVVMHHARHVRQLFYEPFSSSETLLETILWNGRLSECGVPSWYYYYPKIEVRLFESVYDAPRGDLQLPQEGEREQGKHALSNFCGWSEKGERLHFVNTWGIAWGDSGLGSISRAYLDQFMTDAWVARQTRVGPSRFTLSRITQAETNKARATAWLIPNPIRVSRFRYRGFGHRMVYHETVSVWSPGYVSIIELQNGNGLRIAWAFLFHTREEGRPISILKEFYVWPDFRYRGYGSLLESAVADVARTLGSINLQCFFHQIDAWPSIRSIGEQFAKGKGYSLVPGSYELPRLYAIAEKNL